jgi:glycosyltransferase involved in cell wall biosynthesis
MFTDLPANPPQREHWVASLGERISRMFARPKRVAWVYRAPDTSSFRYRASNIVDALNAEPDCEVGAAWFTETELDEIAHLIPDLDAIVIVRYPYNAVIGRLIDRAKRHGVRLVFDCDDLVFDIDFAPLIMETIGKDPGNSREWDVWFAYLGRVEASMRHCTSAITTTEPLREHIGARITRDRVSVVPNFMNRIQQQYSAQLLAAKQDGGWRRTDLVTVGYFSGTPTHARDFALTVPALVRLFDSDPQVTLRVVGFLDSHSALMEYADRIELLPFVDFVHLQRIIAEVEVNLAPLSHGMFNNCKSELKYFEAAAVGTWSIASPTWAVAGAIDDGKTSRLARAHEWDGALAEAVDLARDTTTYAARAGDAAEQVHRTYSWNGHVEGILAALRLDEDLD